MLSRMLSGDLTHYSNRPAGISTRKKRPPRRRRVRKGRARLVAMEEGWRVPGGDASYEGGGAGTSPEGARRRVWKDGREERPFARGARTCVVGKDPGGWVGQRYVAAVSEYVRATRDRVLRKHNSMVFILRFPPNFVRCQFSARPFYAADTSRDQGLARSPIHPILPDV